MRIVPNAILICFYSRLCVSESFMLFDAVNTLRHRSKTMGLILLLIVLVLLFGGGGFYLGPPFHYYGGGLSLIVLIIILLILFRG